ncbi:unnamed protein product, partial [Heterotrigona itama]
RVATNKVQTLQLTNNSFHLKPDADLFNICRIKPDKFGINCTTT